MPLKQGQIEHSTKEEESMFSKLAKATLIMASTMMLSTGLYAGDNVGGTVFITKITAVPENANNTADSSCEQLLSRSILTFHKDGTLLGADSDAQGESPENAPPSGFAPFSIEQGYWEKDHDQIEIKAVDFNYPKIETSDWPNGFGGDQQIVVLTATLKKHGKKWKGGVFLTFYALDADINDPNDIAFGPIHAANISLDPIDRP
ncbi:MAG: hypothetical protein LLG04_00180 [Parachlamydia sp.]|nr:hypothetical protein [Parachlamydia sp.]